MAVRLSKRSTGHTGANRSRNSGMFVKFVRSVRCRDVAFRVTCLVLTRKSLWPGPVFPPYELEAIT
jgi:hypothetical protein